MFCRFGRRSGSRPKLSVNFTLSNPPPTISVPLAKVKRRIAMLGTVRACHPMIWPVQPAINDQYEGNIMMIRTLAIAAALVATPATAATYLPVGPQLNVALTSVTGGGWTQCYSASMATIFGSSAATALAGCSGDRLLVAGRETGSGTLLVLAQALKVDALFNTGAADNGITNIANGTGWYNADDWSFGFAPAGEAVSKNECDTDVGVGRLCIHTLTFSGGYRINDLLGLNNSTDYEKLVFTNAGAVVPEPASWAMLIAGFGLVGAAARRRRAVTAA